MSSLIGISESGLKKNEAGKTYPSFYTLFNLSAQFGISMEWFLFGRGPMFWKEIGVKKVEANEKQVNDLFAQEVEEMVSLMKQIPLLRHSVMGHYQQFKVDKKDFIREELEKTKEVQSTDSAD
jgi:transcriptional regulator with XRE-family HTH domain